jgi:hypothetical protein
MTKNTKILLGIGVGVTAYLLWKSQQKPKGFANANGRRPQKLPTPIRSEPPIPNDERECAAMGGTWNPTTFTCSGIGWSYGSGGGGGTRVK